MNKTDISDILMQEGIAPDTAKRLVKVLNDAGALNIIKGNPEANRIIEAFKQANNVPSVRPTDRSSARVLAEKYGADMIIQIIEIMAHSDGPYKPTVNHIKDIENKWVMIGNYIKKNITREVGF